MSKKREKAHGFKGVKDQSLCWDCACATDSSRCPWATESKPVKGWWAKPHTIWFMQTNADGSRHRVETESYCVIMCPLFRRDAYRGGTQKPYNAPRGGALKGTLYRDVQKLAAAIIEQSIRDWKRLDNGSINKLEITEGMTIKSDELVEFFNSTYFENLLDTVSNRTADEVRSILGVPTT